MRWNLTGRQRNRLRASRLRQRESWSDVDGQAALEIGKSEGRLAVSPICSADEIE